MALKLKWLCNFTFSISSEHHSQPDWGAECQPECLVTANVLPSISEGAATSCGDKGMRIVLIMAKTCMSLSRRTRARALIWVKLLKVGSLRLDGRACREVSSSRNSHFIRRMSRFGHSIASLQSAVEQFIHGQIGVGCSSCGEHFKLFQANKSAGTHRLEI